MKFLKYLFKLLKEFFGFAKQNKAWWIIPMIVVLLLMSVLIVIVALAGQFSIYTLF